jgi:hypothetical protein
VKDRLFGPAALLLFSAFLAFDIWLLFVKPSGSWESHAGVWSDVVGLLAIATGFVSTTELGALLPADKITSPWPSEFLSGNFFLVGFSFNFPVALLYGEAPWTTRRLERFRDTRLWPIEVFVLVVSALLKIIATLLMTLLWLAAVAVYMVLVMPAAYPAYAVVGFPLFAIRHSKVTPEQLVLPTLDPRTIIEAHEVPLRAFAVGGLGTIAGFLLEIIALY